jgi:2-C-methyl-D-erythritol 2,4-cyclodiphosphate synthase
MMRIGHGYDVHAFAPERKLILGGVEIPYSQGLLGHSDADVLCHAISDALLGAAALGDIGKHFPDTDPAYKGANSLHLLTHVVRLLGARGYRIANIDATLILQQPKIAPFVISMRHNIADAAGIDLDQVSVKATTNERLGFEGRGEGACAHAVVLIEKG